MSRTRVRQLKRTIAAGTHQDARPELHRMAQDSALHLLERSIGFGHRRLAVVRLALAANAGAAIADSHWQYCRDAAARSRDPALQQLFLTAAAYCIHPEVRTTGTASEPRSM